MKRWSVKKTVIGIFLGFLGILSVCNILTPQREFSENENRPLASFPPLSSVFSGNFDDSFETWFSDQFIGRDFWIEAKAFVNLHTGSLQNNDVYTGSDGSLIRRFQTYDERTAMRNLQMIRTFIEDTGCQAHFLLVPTAAYIRQDVLPAGAWNLDQKALIDTFCEDLPADPVKVTDALLEAEKTQTVYFRTDHHWNEYGAYTAYQTICAQVLHRDPHTFTYTQVSDNFYGTMYSRSGVFTARGDPISRFDTNGLKASVTYEDGTVIPDLFSEKRLAEKDKYMYYLDGNHPYVKIETNAESGHAVIIKDSYAHILVPYLANEYAVIEMVDLRYYRDPVSDLLDPDTDVYFIYSLDNFCGDPYLAFLR